MARASPLEDRNEVVAGCMAGNFYSGETEVLLQCQAKHARAVEAMLLVSVSTSTPGEPHSIVGLGRENVDGLLANRPWQHG